MFPTGLTFNPRHLPVVIPATPPAPPARELAGLFDAFIKGADHDVRDASAPRVDRMLSPVDVVETFTSDGEHQVQMETRRSLEDAASLTLMESANGVLSLGLTITGRDRRVFADLLDFAAAGLAAMDSHAIQNDWQS